MALAINIEDLQNKQKIESDRIELKKGRNPASQYQCLFQYCSMFAASSVNALIVS